MRSACVANGKGETSPSAALGQSDDDRPIALDVININHAPLFFATKAFEGPKAAAEHDRDHV